MDSGLESLSRIARCELNNRLCFRWLLLHTTSVCLKWGVVGACNNSLVLCIYMEDFRGCVGCNPLKLVRHFSYMCLKTKSATWFKVTNINKFILCNLFLQKHYQMCYLRWLSSGGQENDMFQACALSGECTVHLDHPVQTLLHLSDLPAH